MVSMDKYKMAMDYLLNVVGQPNVYMWKATDKSVVWYEWGADGSCGKKHIVSYENVKQALNA